MNCCRVVFVLAYFCAAAMSSQANTNQRLDELLVIARNEKLDSAASKTLKTEEMPSGSGMDSQETTTAQSAEPSQSTANPSAAPEVSSAAPAGSSAATAAASSVSGFVSNAATTPSPTVITVLEVTSSLDTLGIEKQMQLQFESLFVAFCRSSAYSTQCKPFLSATLRRSNRAVYADCYDVNIPYSTGSGSAVANGQTLYVTVGFLCGEIELLFVPSSLLVPFFTQNNASFTGISITSAYSSVSVSSAAVTSPRAAVDNDAYMIATICLAVFAGLLLVGFIGYVVYVSQKKKRVEAMVTDFPVTSRSMEPKKDANVEHDRIKEIENDSASL